jgi:glycosyltransferase involved in cell wall biosynthesis
VSKSKSLSLPSVLIVSHETTLTGAPIQLLHLARWLHAAGWKLLVVAPDPGPISDLLAADGIPVVIETDLLTDPEHAKLRELAGRFDVVLANTIVSWPAVRAARAANKPAIWYLHETLVAIRLIRQISEIGPTLHSATLLVTPTRQTARVFQGLTTTPVEVVPYGIPRPKAKQKRSRQRTAFVTMASVEPRKGQDILVEAIGKLPREIAEKAHFKFIGRFLEQPFADEVRQSASALEHVEFIGEREHDASLNLLATSDVLVCPSRDETMPITILEAMGLRKAVISADVGGISEWVRNETNGLLVPPENPSLLAAAIERCLTDHELMERICAGAQRTFQRHFTLERFARRFAELLEKVREPRRPRDVNLANSMTRVCGVNCVVCCGIRGFQ